MSEATTRKRRPRSDTGPRLTARDLAALAWIAQQYAIRLDHLSILLARLNEPGQYARTPKEAEELTEKRAKHIVRRWQALGLVHKVWILHGNPEWIYLTPEGLRLVSQNIGQLRTYTPTPAKVEHIYAVNTARLFIEKRRADAVWTSERQLYAGQKIEISKKRPHRPDAVVQTSGRNIAVEVELSSKSYGRLNNILHSLAFNTEYHTVWYFTQGRAQNTVQAAIERQPEYKKKIAVYDLDSLEQGGNNAKV